MVTRYVVLTDQQETMGADLVKEGRFQNASEALRAGLRLLEQEEQGLRMLKAHLATSIAQAEAGEFAEASGAEAIRNAFAEGRKRAGV